MSFDIQIFKRADLSIQVVDGDPPVDQSAEVAALTAQVTQLTADLATRTTERDAAVADAVAKQAKIDAAKAALA